MIHGRHIKACLARMDWLMPAVILSLMVIGVLFIYSAGFRSSDAPVSPLFRRQLFWCLVGLGGYAFLTFVDYRVWVEQAGWIYLVGIVLLVLVLLFGKRVYGAARWLSFMGVQVQPSEFAKVATLLLLAAFLGRASCDMQAPGTLFGSLFIVLVPFVLILKEPDLGTAAVLLPMTLGMLFVAGVPLRIMLFLVLAGLMLLPLGWMTLSPYQKDRLMVFLDPQRDPLGTGWNMLQSVIAVGSGGLTGKGFLQGTQNILGFLPRTVAPTDFIYSVIAEETGFIGSMTVVGLYVLLLLSCVRAASAAPDRFGRLLATGVVIMLFCHVYVNMGMTIGLMPITGLPLPLISYGGSFMVSTMAALGIVQSIYVRREIR